MHLEIDLIGFGIPGFYPSERFDFCACTAGGEDTMTSLLSKKLFFSMTYDFLTVYIPQDSASSKTVKTYRDGLTIFRRYVAEVKGFSIRSFSFSQCTFECCHVQYRRNRKSQQSECVPVSLHSTTYMPDYKNEPAGIEKLLPWSNFIKERCCRLIDVENQTPEPHEPLPI